MAMVWTSQPQILAQPSALARNLGIMRLLTAVNGPNLYDCVTRRTYQPATGASSAMRVLTTKGYGARSNGAASWLIDFDDFELPARRATWLWVGQSEETSTIILRDHTSASGTIPFWCASNTFDMRLAGSDYTAAGTFTQGVAYAVLVSSGPTGAQLWSNGNLIIDSTTPGLDDVNVSPFHLSQNGDGGAIFDTTTVLVAVFRQPFGAAVSKSLTMNPWQLFAPPLPRRRSFIPSAAGGFFSRHYYDMIGQQRLGS